MLCSRSASLISTTRTSDTMASSILRTFSAWRSSRLANWILSILVTPSTMCATWSPNLLADLLAGGRRVFHGVVQQRRRDGRRVQLHLHQHFGHLKRMHNVGLAAQARVCPSWCVTQNSHAFRINEMSSLGRLACTWRSSASKRSPMARSSVGTGQCSREREHCASCRGRHRRAGILCRNGLPDSRHALL